jgi:predicted nucleotidyltransferase
MIDMQKKLDTAAYDFLRSNADLRNVIYLTLSGSHAYGTNKDGSDIDLRGVLVEQPRYLYGLEGFQQFEDRESDTVIYGLKKYMFLCVNANPNALELLGTREDCIVHMSPAGKLLRDHAELFLSRRAIHSFGNYSAAQLRRLSNALCHDSYPPDEQEEHLAATLSGQIEHFNRTYAPMGENALRIYLSDTAQPELLFDVDLKGYPIRDFAGIYGELNNVIKTYGKMNHRNHKKDDAHLYKHAMHLIRLLITGEDILRGNGIVTFRAKEHDLLMAIRNGAYSFEAVMTMAKEYQSNFEQAAKRTQLPDKPDIHKVEKLMRKIYAMEKHSA